MRTGVEMVTTPKRTEGQFKLQSGQSNENQPMEQGFECMWSFNQLLSSISEGEAAICFCVLNILCYALFDLSACAPLFKYEHALINNVGSFKKKKLIAPSWLNPCFLLFWIPLLAGCRLFQMFQPRPVGWVLPLHRGLQYSFTILTLTLRLQSNMISDWKFLEKKKTQQDRTF